MIERLKKAAIAVEKMDYIPIVLLFMLAALILTPLNASLWLDEAVSYWVIKDGLPELFNRALLFQGQSPFYYFLLWCSSLLLGTSEIALRVPSLLFFIGAIGSLYAIALKFFNRRTAVLSVLIFFTMDEVRIASMSARPYSVALCCAFLSIMFLQRLLETCAKKDVAAFVLTTVLAYYAHYLFAAILIVHIGVWLLYGAKARKCFVFALILITLSFIPSFVQLHALLSRRVELTFAAVPSLLAFAQSIFVPYIVVILGLGLVLIRIFTPLSFDTSSCPKKSIILALFYFLTAPLIFYFASLIDSGFSLFVQRYFLWYSGGLAMLYAAACLCFKEKRRTSLLLPAIMLLLLLREGDRKWQIEDWHGAVQEGNEIAFKEDLTTMLLYSGLIESKDSYATKDSSVLEYLSAPLQYYRTKTTVFPLPPIFEIGKSNENFMDWLSEKIKNEEKVLLICNKQNIFRKHSSVVQLPQAFVDLLKKQAFHMKAQKSFGQIELILFEKQ